MSVFDPFAQKLDTIAVKQCSVDVDGVSTAYWEYGNPRSPIQLVLIHGFRGDHHGLEPIVAELGPDIHCVIPDLPGFGLSSPLPSPATIESFRNWLVSFLNILGVPAETVVLGHSFGSIVVASAASEISEHRLILINPIAANALQGPRGVLTRLAVLYYKLAAVLPERMGFALLKNKAIVRIMSVTMAKTKDKDLRKWIHHQHDLYFSDFATRESLLEAFETSVSNDVSEYSSTISQDILLLVADLDDITALPQQRELAAGIPQSSLEIVSGVGHLVHYEAADFAADNIRQFLRAERPE